MEVRGWRKWERGGRERGWRKQERGEREGVEEMGERERHNN